MFLLKVILTIQVTTVVCAVLAADTIHCTTCIAVDANITEIRKPGMAFLRTP
jgi:hypothetical protein